MTELPSLPRFIENSIQTAFALEMTWRYGKRRDRRPAF
jgi:hypothetical protein